MRSPGVLILAGGVLKELTRRKDIYIIFALLIVILLYSASLSFGGESSFQRYFREIGISLAYVFSVIIAVTFASRQMPQELETKSVYYILSRPVSRFGLITGKFAGVFFVSAASFLLFYAAYIISLLLHGDSFVPAALLLEGFMLHLCALAFFTAFSIMLSIFVSAASNSVISLVLYFGFSWFGAAFPAYICLPHPELFDIRDKIVHSWDAVPSGIMTFLILYAAAYTAVFLLAAYAALRGRDL
jgi:ABC-type transport system involved in multi-copper enzyme maturation permease subunit